MKETLITSYILINTKNYRTRLKRDIHKEEPPNPTPDTLLLFPTLLLIISTTRHIIALSPTPCRAAPFDIQHTAII
jgi:hypothetical protein